MTPHCGRQLLGPVVLFMLSMAAAAASCGGQDRVDDQKSVTPTYNKEGRLQRLDYDSNGNGKPDVHTYMDGNRVVRSEIDPNEDGVIDRWEYYDDKRQLVRVGTSSAGDSTVDTWAYPPSGGQLARVERSSKRDEIIDRREFMQDDEVVKAEEDSDRDGRIDRWETYKNGVLATLSLDTTRRLGRADRRLVYGEGGDVVRVEVDPDGDGVFEPASPGTAPS